MIKMQIVLDKDEYGASIYKLKPSAIIIGNQNANNVDTMCIEYPEEWRGITIRATFIGSRINDEPIALIVPDSGIIEVGESITGAKGVMVVDAFEEGYHAYTTNTTYTVANHAKVGGTEPTYTPTQIEQILAQVQIYANTASSKATEAQTSANAASTSASSSAGAASLANASALSAQRAANNAEDYASNASDDANRATEEANRAKTEADRTEGVADHIRTEFDELSSKLKKDIVDLQNEDESIREALFSEVETLNGYIDEEIENRIRVTNSLGNRLTTVENNKLNRTELTIDYSDSLVPAMLGSTSESYHRVMRWWFLKNGANTATTEDLTALCDRWYEITRTPWSGGTEFYLPEYSSSSDGFKIGDNEGMFCEPSTDLVKGIDEYEGHPLFACTDCNWILDNDGNILITAIDGITDNFERYNVDKYVGVLQQSAWHWWEDREETFVHGISSYRDERYANCKPYPEAQKIDGTMRQWVCHGKYMSATVNGKMTCCSGQIPTAFISHNSLHTLSSANGAQYSGGTVVDWSFLVLMTFIKYASMTQDARIQGCCSHNFQYYVAVGETNTNRLILTSAQTANIPVGSSLEVGTYNGSSTDRGTASNYNIGFFKVKSVQPVTISGTAYSAVYLDTDRPFNTVANGSAVSGSTIVSSWHWQSGTCDSVVGNDGSKTNRTNGKYPAKLQGIEYAVGGYDVFADVILWLDGVNYEPFTVKRKNHQSTSKTNNYKASGLLSAQPSADAWLYIRRLGYNGEIFFGVDTNGGGSSTYVKDAFYKQNVSNKSTAREWLAFGFLYIGSGTAGLSCLNGTGGLGYGSWHYLGRLSPQGNWGELSA